MTVKKLLREIDSEELAEWQAWMIIQRENEPGRGQQVTGQPDAEGQLRKLFGKRE